MFIGIDIGGTKCAAVLGYEADGCMKIAGKLKFETIHGENAAEKNLEKLADYTKKLLADNNQACDAIGISCGGPLDSKRGIVMAPPNLPEWDDIDAAGFFANRFGAPAFLQNDANACALAEYRYGAGRGFSDVVFLTFGTGMGAGLILNGRLYSGSRDMAGEVGHIRLAARGPVGYGKSGSFEGFCSGGGIAKLGCEYVKRAQKRGENPRLLEYCGSLERINAKDIAELADEGDTLCAAVYKKSGEMLGCGLAVIADMLNPEAVIIGSIYSRSGALLEDECRKYLRREALEINAGCCRILRSELGDAIGDYAALSVAADGIKNQYK